ncbi:MAG: hypothetical protein A2213_08060 [Lysobacterales bacterium RIFOXYA1_FULL_68_6]|nr:MAG: hypothetical protein A2213_08060 [Xanthomonadales bacterium RIFOXYA1_FULL_68_6]
MTGKQITVESLIAEARQHAAKNYALDYTEMAEIWEDRAAWLQVKLDALPPEQAAPAMTSEPPTSHTFDTACPMCGFNITVRFPKSALPPYLAEALKNWVVGFRTCQVVSDESKALAAA